jgi:hypothetical protein
MISIFKKKKKPSFMYLHLFIIPLLVTGEKGKDERNPSVPSFHTNDKTLGSTMKSILKGLTKRKSHEVEVQQVFILVK